MKSFFLIIFLLTSGGSTFLQAQIKVSGIIKDSVGEVLQNASISLQSVNRNTLYKEQTTSNSSGIFLFNNAPNTSLKLTISFIGYKTVVDTLHLENAKNIYVVDEVILTPTNNMLDTILVSESKITIKEDTITYKVDSTMYKPNDNVEQMLKKQPGIEIDKTGKITAHGQEVTKVKVNGKEFFGGDVKTATQNLNADMIDKFQIIDDYGEQSAFTGVKTGESSKTLNLQLKKEKNRGWFGKLKAGVGTQSRYKTSAFINYFQNEKQISFNGGLNNANADLFDFSSLPQGISSMVRSTARATGISDMANSLANNDGITTAKSWGINVTDVIGKKTTYNFSYAFSDKLQNITTISDYTIIQKDSTMYQHKESNADNNVSYHRFTGRIKYSIDSLSEINLSPTITYSNSNNTSAAPFIQYNNRKLKTISGSNSNHYLGNVPNIDLAFMYNKRLKRKGSFFSVRVNSSNNKTTGEDSILNHNYFYNNLGELIFVRDVEQLVNQAVINKSINSNIVYNYAFDKNKALEFSCNFSNRLQTNNKQTYALLNLQTQKIDSLSNEIENTFNTQKIGATYRFTQKKYNYAIGVAAQPAITKTYNFDKNLHYNYRLFNFLPNVRFVYNFTRTRTFTCNYNTATSQPSYVQLQPVPDFSNLQNIVVGNPSLKPEFSHRVNIRYNNFNFVKGNLFVAFLNVNYTSSKVVSNIISKNFGQQETHYLNANGVYSVNAYYTITKPFKNRKYIFTLSGTGNTYHNISYLNSEKNIGNNVVVIQRINFDYNLKKWLETSFACNYTLNQAKYSKTAQNNSKYNIFTISHSARIFFPKQINVSYDLTKTWNKGLEANIHVNPFLINANIDKQFGEKRKFTLSFEVFDILNQNVGISRNVTANSIVDTRTNRLARYCMLTAIYNLNNFQKNKKQSTLQSPMQNIVPLRF